jgi:hypothetical protein
LNITSFLQQQERLELHQQELLQERLELRQQELQELEQQVLAQLRLVLEQQQELLLSCCKQLPMTGPTGMRSELAYS